MTTTRVEGRNKAKQEEEHVLGMDKKREPKRQKGGWRIAESLAVYIEERAKGLGRGAETEIVEDCFRLHKELNEQLEGQRVRLAQYALDVGLDVGDESTVIGQLVLKGLAAHEGRKK